jgi:hypothetical protein
MKVEDLNILIYKTRVQTLAKFSKLEVFDKQCLQPLLAPTLKLITLGPLYNLTQEEHTALTTLTLPFLAHFYLKYQHSSTCGPPSSAFETKLLVQLKT